MKRMVVLRVLAVVFSVVLLFMACGGGGGSNPSGDNPSGDNPPGNDPPGDDPATPLSVQLIVKNDLADERVQEPVSYGVPLSVSDNITSVEQLRVYPRGGTSPMAAQFDVIARYNGLPSDEEKPVRTVLCTFFTDVAANSQALFELKNDGRATAEVPPIVSDNSDHLVFDTGVLQARISKTRGFAGFDRVTVNGSVLSDGALDDGLFVQADDGTWYASSNQQQPDKVEVEYNGPLKAVVAVHGYFEDSANNRFTEPGYYFGLSYVTRITAFKGKPYLLVQTTVKNENIGGVGTNLNTGETMGGRQNQNFRFNRMHQKITLNQLDGTKRIKLMQYSNDTATGSYSVFQDHVENADHDESQNFVYEIKAGDAVQYTGERFDAYMAFGDSSNGGLMAATRWFWENWPKGITADADSNVLLLELWPDIDEDHVFRGGSWKTHEAVFGFFDNTLALDSAAFAEELHAVKDRLILFIDNVHTTDFMDYVPSKDLTTDHVFQGGEILQKVVELHNKTILAKFDRSEATHHTDMYDIDYLRETRPKIWRDTIADPALASTPIDWYGWMDFGGLVRDDLGFGSLNYEWDFLAAMQGLRFQKTAMMEESEKMSRHYGDMLIIHAPVDSDRSISLSTGAIFTENGHGGQRTEWASDDRYFNFVSSNLNNSIGQYCHSFPRGTMLQYLITGDRYYADVISHIGDHIKYNYSGFVPGHADARPSGDIKNCTGDQPCFDGGLEYRVWARAIAAAVDVWKATGDPDYLTIGKGVFNNALLPAERIVGGQRMGVLGRDDTAHMFYQVLTIKPVIHLYHACLVDGDDVLAGEIAQWLQRHAQWMRDDVYANWRDGDGIQVAGGTMGTGGHAGEYFPYAVMNADWDKNDPWTPDTHGYADPSYSGNYADLFALVYRTTNDDAWLDLARAVYKDGWTYGTGAGEWVTVSDTLDLRIRGVSDLPGNAWLKKCKYLTKPMYYLKVEEEVSR